MPLPELSDNDLVATVKKRATAVVDYRMDPKHGNNPSVLTSQQVAVALSTSEIGSRDHDSLQTLLESVIGSKAEARGFSFTIAAATPGGIGKGAVNIVFMQTFS